ncbi:hypothetical protein ACFL5Q_04865 [Planctomycetota bacterium]
MQTCFPNPQLARRVVVLWCRLAVWTVGMFLKAAFFIPLSTPILEGIEASVPHEAYLVLGSLYVGLSHRPPG